MQDADLLDLRGSRCLSECFYLIILGSIPNGAGTIV